MGVHSILIIGILAAVALPQYQIAVGKSRMTQALTWVRALKEAELVYFLANGKYTSDPSELDISIPGCNLETEEKPEGVGASYFYYPCSNGWRVVFDINNPKGHGSVYAYLPEKNENGRFISGLELYFQNNTLLCTGYTDLWKKVCKSMGGTQYGSYTMLFKIPN